ncbi:PA2817 family protein [Simiduia agarivorans]|uniref:Dehydrogenase n=1 Tax=Simiduia agarivorans (strain DSM 21679 / JCM 13881 / BCRC 17597 / SA1) TaxID=1117647 RepID=K4KVQ9_SIMAS|nr:PA2817 family protein [Simiduia agarivorans]AFU98027.1 hypothetical protein M5M_04100 [Simiduia agarivorans SA1 = DSM 21679]
METRLDYLAYHKHLIAQLAQRATELLESAPFREEAHSDLSKRLTALVNASPDDAFYTEGQACLCKIIAAWPQLTSSVARDLLWFFGGDCLQFMPDDEIRQFQTLDEARFEAESTGDTPDYGKLRQQIFGLH